MPKGGVLAQLVQIFVRPQQRLDERVLGIFLVAARANQLPIDRILVRGSESVEILHRTYYPAAAPVPADMRSR